LKLKKKYDLERQEHEKESSEEEEKKKPPLQRHHKDPNAPKRPFSAFMYYANDTRGHVKQENPDLKFGDLAKKVGENFKALSNEQRKVYEDISLQAKHKYEEELELYNKSQTR